MSSYEYKVVPAPPRGEKVRGVKNAEGRFAHAIERLMNDMAADGWEYQRAETLPSEERTGLTKTATVWRNLLVFRRGLTSAEETFQAEPLPEAPPQLAAPVPEPDPTPAPAPSPETTEEPAQAQSDVDQPMPPASTTTPPARPEPALTRGKPPTRPRNPDSDHDPLSIALRGGPPAESRNED